MNKVIRIATVVMVLALGVALVMGSGTAIGVATAPGSFTIDRATVVGNGTVFEGALVETTEATPELVLSSGVKVRMGSAARGKVYRDRLVMERGAAELNNLNRYTVEASKLRLIPTAGGAAATVAVAKPHLVQIAALRGAFRVETAGGMTVANMAEGMALEFDTQGAGAQTPMRLCGTVESRGGKVMLTDKTANITVELRGSNLGQYTGRSVAVSGNPAGTGADRVLQVLTVAPDSCSGRAGAAAAGGAAAGAGAGAAAAGAAGGAAGAALSTAAIAGIVVAGATAASVGIYVATKDESK